MHPHAFPASIISNREKQQKNIDCKCLYAGYGTQHRSWMSSSGEGLLSHHTALLTQQTRAHSVLGQQQPTVRKGQKGSPWYNTSRQVSG